LFLERGFYPFSKDYNFEDFAMSLQQINEKIIIEDLPTFKVFKTISLIKLKKLFYFIANNRPSEISFLSLSKKI
jgi:predicted AAA+ superfamily ATPase